MAHPANYRDFDAMWAERGLNLVPVRVLGRDYEIPAKLPALVALRIARMRAGSENSAVVSDLEINEMAEMVLGKANVDTMLADGIEIDQLGDVLQYVLSIAAGAEPNPPAPARIEMAARHPGALGDDQADFQREYGIDLSAALGSMTWRRFFALVNGLSSGSRLAQAASARQSKISDPDAVCRAFSVWAGK